MLGGKGLLGSIYTIHKLILEDIFLQLNFYLVLKKDILCIHVFLERLRKLHYHTNPVYCLARVFLIISHVCCYYYWNFFIFSCPISLTASEPFQTQARLWRKESMSYTIREYFSTPLYMG